MADVQRAFDAAINAATNPAYRPCANPRVGCTLLDARGEIIAIAGHSGDGAPHAEVAALTTAFAGGDGGRVRGGTAVVTLEPCNHVGKTGSCASALINAGVARVVFGVADPGDASAGGAQRLRAAGVRVEGGVREAECENVDPAWFAAARMGRPHVTWKFAATLDGFSAAADGTSQWITGEPARARVHELRRAADTIVAGTGTVLADNPRLTVRDAAGAPMPARVAPLRCIVGAKPTHAATNTWNDDAPTIQLAQSDPKAVLTQLHALGRRRVFLEGGPRLAAGFLAAGVVDEIHAFIAPVLLGAGRRAVGDLGIETLAAAHRFKTHHIERVGADTHITLTAPKEH